jgi:hypothetical protein
MEHEIVEVPKSQVLIAFRKPGIAFASRIGLQNDLAISQQGQNFDPRETILLLKLPNGLRGRQCGEEAQEFRIADPEEGGGAGRLEHDFISPAAEIREPGENDSVAIAELRHLRPIADHLRLDNNQVFAAVWVRDAIFQQAVTGEPTEEEIDLFIRMVPIGRERTQLQARAQLFQARRRSRAKSPQHEGVILENGNDCAARVRLDPRPAG